MDNETSWPRESARLLSTDRHLRFGRSHHERIDRESADQVHERTRVGEAHPFVEISPPDCVDRRTMTWHGMAAESVQSKSHDRIEYRFDAPVHLLAMREEGVRRDGETFVEGLPQSTLRDLGRKLTFVPAGHAYREWQESRNLTSLMYFYVDPAKLQFHFEFDIAAISFPPRLLFEDATLWNTAQKLKRSVENPTSDHLYSEALGVVLVHELVRLNCGAPRTDSLARGGLATWHQRIVAAYIEEHFAEQISLATLAGLVGLSPYHFCRAFKQSFGMPPHRYHTSRRIQHAKTLLANPAISVTDIGLTVGYGETSSFTAAFRKACGLTPTGYRRSLG